jgi:hypothetical protein
MKIKGQNPNTVFPRSQGHMVQVFDPRGTYWRKWPRSRPGPLHPTTEAQAALFDLANTIVKFPDPSEFVWATQQSQGTAFYARDILISAMYGNYVSWPGVGSMADGPSLDDSGAPVQPLSRARPRTTSTAKNINSVRSYNTERWIDPLMTINVSTNLPAVAPMLYMSCEPYQLIPKKTLFGGQYVPHGRKQYAPSLCGQFDFTSGGGQTFQWDIMPCCACGGDCFYWIGEQDPTTLDLQWSGIIRPCPQCNTGQLLFFYNVAGAVDWQDGQWNDGSVLNLVFTPSPVNPTGFGPLETPTPPSSNFDQTDCSIIYGTATLLTATGNYIIDVPNEQPTPVSASAAWRVNGSIVGEGATVSIPANTGATTEVRPLDLVNLPIPPNTRVTMVFITAGTLGTCSIVAASCEINAVP